MATKFSHKEIRNILRAAWFTPGLHGRWGLPLLLMGDPGTGKTSGLMADAEALGLNAKCLIGSIYDPTDFGGTPSQPLDGGRFQHILLPNWLQEVEGWTQGGVLVLDELTCVPAAQQAAMLRLVLEGRVGDYRIDPRVRIVAAANPPEQAAGGQGLAMPMANRFGHLHVEPASLDDWFDILAGEFYAPPADAAQMEADVLGRFDAEYTRAQKLAKGFLRKFPDLAQATPKAGSPEAEDAWTSRRTWEFAMRALAGSRVHGLTADERDGLLAAYLGDATARQFCGWLASSDIPEAEDVLDGKVQWTPVVHRPDITQAVLDMCVACVQKSDQSLKISRARKLWTLLAGLVDTPDLGLTPAFKLGTDVSLVALPEAAACRKAMSGVSYAINAGGLRR